MLNSSACLNAGIRTLPSDSSRLICPAKSLPLRCSASSRSAERVMTARVWSSAITLRRRKIFFGTRTSICSALKCTSPESNRDLACPRRRYIGKAIFDSDRSLSSDRRYNPVKHSSLGLQNECSDLPEIERLVHDQSQKILTLFRSELRCSAAQRSVAESGFNGLRHVTTCRDGGPGYAVRRHLHAEWPNSRPSHGHAVNRLADKRMSALY